MTHLLLPSPPSKQRWVRIKTLILKALNHLHHPSPPILLMGNIFTDVAGECVDSEKYLYRNRWFRWCKWCRWGVSRHIRYVFNHYLYGYIMLVGQLRLTQKELSVSETENRALLFTHPYRACEGENSYLRTALLQNYDYILRSLASFHRICQFLQISKITKLPNSFRNNIKLQRIPNSVQISKEHY